MEIADDGRGGADPGTGTGLRGLADRVEALGGRLALESPPGAGTVVRAALPLRTHDRALTLRVACVARDAASSTAYWLTRRTVYRHPPAASNRSPHPALKPGGR